MTHFQPSHYIDFTDSRVLISKILSYHVDLYDSHLSPTGSLQRTPPNWRNADPKLFEGLRKKFPPEKARAMTDSLAERKEEFSSIENVQFIFPDEVIVRFNSFDTAGHRRKFYDRWMNERGAWKLVSSDVVQVAADSCAILDDNNYLSDEYSFTNASSFGGISYVEIKSAAPTPRIGHTIEEAGKLSDEYLKRNEPEFVFTIFHKVVGESTRQYNRRSITRQQKHHQ
jgi:hypothetical protein